MSVPRSHLSPRMEDMIHRNGWWKQTEGNLGILANQSLGIAPIGNAVHVTGALGRLDGVVFLQVVALKTNDVSNEQLPVLGSHSDEAGVEAVSIAREWKGIKPQHFD